MKAASARATRTGIGTLILAAAISLAACGKGTEAGTPAKAKRYRIGIALGANTPEAGSLEALACEGLRQVAEAYGGYIKDETGGARFGDKVELRCLGSRLQGQDREQLVRVLAEERCDLVLGVGLPFADVMRKAAKDFPETSFALVDADLPDLDGNPNLARVGFAEQEGSFLAGALAGMIVRDRPKAKVGFIGGMDEPLVHKYDSGFRAGAAFVDPALRKKGMILRQYCGKDKTAFSDPATAKAIATSQYRAGAEVVYHAAGGSGAGLFEAAREAGKLAIGSDSDQGLACFSGAKDLARAATGERIASSMLKRVDRAIFVLSAELIGTGRVKGGYRLFNLANDGVALAVNAYNKERIAPYEDALAELKARIISGEIRVPADDPSCEDFISGLK